MAKQISKVPVCFNVLDPDQLAMWEWVCSRRNRSGYLKRLIQRDMDAAGGPVVKAYRPETAGELDFQASSFI